MVRKLIFCFPIFVLLGCEAGVSPSQFEPTKRSEKLQEEFIADVTEANIAAALDRRCSEVTYDEGADEVLVEQFAVKALILASRERKDAKWAAAYLDQTEKLRKSTLTKELIAAETTTYLEEHFAEGWEEDQVCEQALAEISDRSGIGRFLDRR